jgi:hypothetical protein
MGLNTLVHEAQHLAGNMNEAVTECYALQTIAFAAQELGASTEQGQALAAHQLATTYPRLPDSYRTGDCEDGGKLDLRPDTDVWP